MRILFYVKHCEFPIVVDLYENSEWGDLGTRILGPLNLLLYDIMEI